MARREEQPDSRSRRHFYGADDPLKWRPFFQPPGENPLATSRPIYNLADETLANHGILDRKFYLVGSELGRQMEHARAHQRVVILIMDPWLIYTTAYSAFLQDLAEHLANGYPVGGLVVYNRDDTETKEREDDFREELTRLLKVRLEEIQDRNDLAGTLDRILERAPNLLMQRASRRRGDDGPAGASPIAAPPPDRSDRPVMRRRPIGEMDQK